LIKLTTWFSIYRVPQSDQFDAAFAALANPTRRNILARLAQGAASVNALAEPFDMSLPAISKHIRVLENAGPVTRGRAESRTLCAERATA